MTDREREARIRERLERDYVVNMDDGEWLLARVERYREALEDLIYNARSLADSMAVNEREKLLESLDRAHRALNDGEDDG